MPAPTSSKRPSRRSAELEDRAAATLAQRRADRAAAREAQDREDRNMRKGGKVGKMACGGKTRRMKAGGMCRGMGAATRGGNYSRG